MHDEWQASLHAWTHREGEWSNSQARAWVEQIREKLFTTGDYAWLLTVLDVGPSDGHQNFNLLYWLLLDLKPIPDILFSPLLRAAVLDPDPSFNKWFIEICLREWGGRRVNQQLLSYTQGTNIEKAGVANAFYWSFALAPRYTLEDSMEDLRQQKREWMLQEFVVNNDIWVRRNLISGLNLEPESYPEALHFLIPQAIVIAQNHTDDYIRHRIKIQLGIGGPLNAKPIRS